MSGSGVSDDPEVPVFCRIEMTATKSVGMGERPHTGLRSNGTGIGMKNVQERLEVLYGNEASFKAVSNPGRGTLVSIEIPADLPESK